MLGIKYSELINMMNKGMTIDQIKAQNQNHSKRKKNYTRDYKII